MNHSIRSVAVGVLVLGASLRASDITFSGYTDGCFGACSVTDSGGALQTSVFNVGGPSNPVLNFANADLSGTTSGGTFLLNASGSASSLNFNNLGGMDQFAIGTGTAVGTTFQLMVTFTAPFPQSHIFNATVTGTDGASGHALIDFSASTPFLFSSGGTSFDLSVANVSLVANGPDNAIVGTLSVNSVAPSTAPEPSSLALVGLGTAALVFLRLRRA